MVLSGRLETASSLAVYFTSMGIRWGNDLFGVSSSRGNIIIFSPYTIPVLVYGLLYVLALFGSASIAYFNKLSGRFLLPFYIPFITLLVLTLDVLMHFVHLHSPQKLRRIIAIGFVGMLIVIGIGLLRITIPVALAISCRWQ